MAKRRGKRMLTIAASVALTGLLAHPVEADKKIKGRRGVTPEEQISFGVDMAKRGLWNEALFRFKRAGFLRPGDPRILNNLAVAYEAVGDFDQALETYKKALRADPGDRELKRNYARFVEFYQSFRPPEATEQAADEAPEQSAESDQG